MNGMIPYVDFADSKGPLLWLIYGIGYLISHHSYIGVFWISVLFYTVTLFAAYKLCRLFVDKDVAAVSTAALPFFLFVFYCGEIKTEDFCYTFIMLSLYCACRILRYRDSDARTYFRLSALMGVCSMGALLMKYNIGCMIMGLMAVVLYMAIRHKAGWQGFAGMAIGFVAPAIPFVICFLIYGNMGAFIQEYFLNTFETIENKGQTIFSIKNIRSISALVVLLFILVFGICYVSKKHKLGYWLIPCLLLFLVGLGGAYLGTYYMVILPFFIFIILTIADLIFRKYAQLRKNTAVLCVIMAICILAIRGIIFQKNYRVGDEEACISNYYKAAYVMSQIENPKLLGGSNFGVAAHGLPACRYWIEQSGATEEMIKEREKDLESGVADFVCVSSFDEEAKRNVENCGYVFYCNAPVFSQTNINPAGSAVYGRPGLRLPPADFHVSQWDVWLKRNIFGI